MKEQDAGKLTGLRERDARLVLAHTTVSQVTFRTAVRRVYGGWAESFVYFMAEMRVSGLGVEVGLGQQMSANLPCKVANPRLLLARQACS